MSAADPPSFPLCSKPEHRIYLGIGSNIAPLENLPRSLELLRLEARVEAVSNAWRTPAVGSAGPDFLNAAALVCTPLPYTVFKNVVLRKIEAQMGRVRTYNKYAPRTIDLDILIVDEKVIDPKIWKETFLAVPLAELLPEFHNPETGETLAQAAARMSLETPVSLLPDVIRP